MLPGGLTRGPAGWKSLISCGFKPEIDPGTPLDRPGGPRTSICTKNQPRRPILKPLREVFEQVPSGMISFREEALLTEPE